VILDLRLPDLGYSIEGAVVVAWLVGPGDEVGEGQLLVEVETDKAAVSIPSPVAGRIHSIMATSGERIVVGEVMVTIEGADATAGMQASTPDRAERRPRPVGPETALASPFVRDRANALGLDVDRIVGTGARGAITEHDLEVAAGRSHGQTGAQLESSGSGAIDHLDGAIPAVTVVEECDFTGLWREAPGYERFAFVLKMVAEALGRHPSLNASWTGGELQVHPHCDFGIAVETRRGLVVPVLRGVEHQSLDELAAGIRGVIRAARAQTLTATQLGGSTFTVTNGGQMGGLFATPLLNSPEVAILGVHRVSPRPVVRGGEIVVRDMAFLSCTFDHRAGSGAEVGTFLGRIVARIEAYDRGGPP